MAGVSVDQINSIGAINHIMVRIVIFMRDKKLFFVHGIRMRIERAAIAIDHLKVTPGKKPAALAWCDLNIRRDIRQGGGGAIIFR